MKLTEISKLLDIRIEMLFADVNGRWYCHFVHTEIMERGMLISVSGRGDSPEKALRELALLMGGKRIAYFRDGSRQEFVLPESLTA